MARDRIIRTPAEKTDIEASGRIRRSNAKAEDTRTSNIEASPARQRLSRKSAAPSPSEGRDRRSNIIEADDIDRQTVRQKSPSRITRSERCAADAVRQYQGVETVCLTQTTAYSLVITFAREAWGDSEVEVAGLARSIGNTGTGIILCRVGRSSRDVGKAGVDRIAHIDDTDWLRTLAYLTEICRAFDPQHIVVPYCDAGNEIARHLAATLSTRPAIGVSQIRGKEILVSTADGRQEYVRPLPRIMSVRDIACRAVSAPVSRDVQSIAQGTLPAQDCRLTDDGLLVTDASMLPLEEAEFIVSAGDGITDFSAFDAVARQLSATIAGSRVVCDAGLLPRHRQIGASGHIAQADCYFALGISGAPQHLEGIRNCRHVVAVNTDLHAAMVQRADLAIIVDAQAVMPALIRARGLTNG